MRKASKVCFSTKINIIPPAAPLRPSSCPFVCPTFSQRASQRNRTSQLSNPPAVSEDGRWSPALSTSAPPPPQPSLSYSLVQHGKVASYSRLFHKFCVHILSKHRRERKQRGLSSWRLGSGWLMLLPRSRMTTKGPPTPTALPMAFPFPVSV